MSISINSNISSVVAQNNLSNTEMNLQSTMAKLSSGFRITKASDDAAGMSISSNLEAQIGSYNQASRNANDGQQIIQTAEGAMNQTTALLTRLRELAEQSASSTVGNSERGYIQDEVTQLTSEIDRIANATEFNGTKLLNSSSTTLTFQIGIRNVAANDQITVSSVDVTAATLGVSSLSLSTQSSAQSALSTIDSAINTVNSNQSIFGGVSNRLASVIQTISTASQGLQAADSGIKDVDVAQETSNLTRLQVLLQAGVSVLSQANQQPSVALKLLQ